VHGGHGGLTPWRDLWNEKVQLDRGCWALVTSYRSQEKLKCAGEINLSLSADSHPTDMTVIVTAQGDKTSALTRLGGGGGGDAAQPAERSRCGEINAAAVRHAENTSKAQSHDTSSPPEGVLLTREFRLSLPHRLEDLC